MKSIPATDFGRGTRAILDLDALRHNLAVVRQQAPDSRVMAVVKANAYGHGIEQVVESLLDADGFAVATVAEAARVRSVTRDHPVLLLEGVIHPRDLEAAEHLDLWMVVHSATQIDLLSQASPQRPWRVWLKVDTGMHRLGFRIPEAEAALARLRALPSVDPDIVLMSHLANADDRADPKTDHQLERFRKLRDRLGLQECSLANSAGALGWPATRFDWVRVGLALYGASPLDDRSWGDLGLRPCMTLESTLIAINLCQAGDSIGYGGLWRCPSDTRVGVVGIGYGDGYPRHADNGTPVWLAGQVCSIIGRVSMDMLTIDLQRCPDAQVGDRVELWGAALPVEIVARRAETIAYELLCGIAARVPAVYVGGGKGK